MGLPHPQADSKLLREHNFYNDPSDSVSSTGSTHGMAHHCNSSALHLAILFLAMILIVKMHYVIKRFYSGYLNRSHTSSVLGSPKIPSKKSMNEKAQVDELV